MDQLFQDLIRFYHVQVSGYQVDLVSKSSIAVKRYRLRLLMSVSLDLLMNTFSQEFKKA